MITENKTQGAYSRIQIRRGTAYEWKTINPILAEGEFVVEVPDEGVGTGYSRFKIGDGVRKYADLPYAIDGAGASKFYGGGASLTNSGILQIRADTTENWTRINPVLSQYEYVFTTDVKGFKMGDGKSTWTQLPYLEFGSEWDANNNVIVDCGDEANMTVGAAAKATSTVYQNYAAKNGKSVDTYDKTLLPEDWDKNVKASAPAKKNLDEMVDLGEVEEDSDGEISTKDLFKD